MTTVNRLNKFFDEELGSGLRDVLITRDHTGRYTLFGEYSIVPTKNGYFRVLDKTGKIEFTTIRNALAYVTLVHAGKRKDADRIERLDLSLSSINVDLAIHRNILRGKTDPESRLIYIIKIQEDSIKRRRIIAEIKAYINSSIRIQERRFDTARKPSFKHK